MAKKLYGQVDDALDLSFESYDKMAENTAVDEITDYFMDEHIKIGITDDNQPNNFESEQFVIVLDGNIYNISSLKDYLEKKDVKLLTDSDAEVLLHLYTLENENMVRQLRGMFAIIIWDKLNQELFAARDSFGMKPFFYKETEFGVLFASTQQALFNQNEEELSTEALHNYLTFQYVPNYKTAVKNIHQLKPGHILIKKLNEKVILQRYSHLDFQIDRNKTLETAIPQVRYALEESVSEHMESDKSIGAYLSGGIDSTSIVSLAKQHCATLQTFTVGFQREAYSEMELAQETAQELGVTNIQKVITPEEVVSELPNIIWQLGDPVADPAAIPNYFVAKEASKYVDVVLSGEGADELFGGYNIYKEPQALRIFDFLPRLLRKGLFNISQLFPDGVKGKSYIERGTTPLSQRYVGNAHIFNEKEKRTLLTHYNEKYPYSEATKELFYEVKDHDPSTQMQYIDLHTWLQGDILTVADRMTSAHSLEMRAPFLDKQVFDVARTLPTHLKLQQGTTKYVLRKAVEDLVPSSVMFRRKLGFPVPIRDWLRNELYEWAKYTIEHSSTGELFHKQKIQALLEDHAQQKLDHSRELWTILTFMIWYEMFMTPSGIAAKPKEEVIVFP
ncbi:MAG TPA: asparagine synthase (glutamine-hydrolyzing) [Virgibacillus sp.]|nr:asparagine synthase (glutamine-hydrolyzing) [Virgibacillus sp.]HLR68985.1 asparagine synthase (glutamine-hydrolyzing) [Virgibacillus sp.]